ncbi:hypothetical protein GCM10023085_12350 [Actinomadura viridis]|uniref:Uncharacterized protein n=1 Tax=Actinomadura viridis TaxID=58110 RepID=A0A931DPA8_9ACTN|nr:hypothetical protein [Actinomadura viridis]MBG6093610.1 hypothetical protein [Actinomadura viridis]
MGVRRDDLERAEESLARLRERLRSEAGRHEPDRDRIWSRIEASMDRSGAAVPEARPGASGRRARGRIAMASLATAAVVGAVGAVGAASGAYWEFTRGGATRPPVTAPPATGPPAAHRPVNGVPSSGDARPDREKGPLSSGGTLDPGSGPHWAQNNLTLRVRDELRALTVTIRVARTERVRATGSWLSLPNGDFRPSTETTADAVVYRWTLLPGRTVRPGSYVLAAQYDRTAGHDPRQDTYTVEGTPRDGPSAAPVTVEGHF